MRRSDMRGARRGRRIGGLSGTSGSVSVEAVIWLPILLWSLGAIYVFTDGYRSMISAVRATYTVSDLLSRQGGVIDDANLDGMAAMLDALVDMGGAAPGDAEGASLRLTVVRSALVAVSDLDDDDDDGPGKKYGHYKNGKAKVRGSAHVYDVELVIEYSEVSGDMAPIEEVSQIEEHIPPMAVGDRVAVVEGVVPWSPPLILQIGQRDLHFVSVVRPRFSGSLMCWESCLEE